MQILIYVKLIDIVKVNGIQNNTDPNWLSLYRQMFIFAYIF